MTLNIDFHSPDNPGREGGQILLIRDARMFQLFETNQNANNFLNNTPRANDGNDTSLSNKTYILTDTVIHIYYI